MNLEERLNSVATRYRNLGFEVIVNPRSEELPTFAKKFNVQIVAKKNDESILTVAKSTPIELQADKEVALYRDIVEKQPGWRLDVFVLGPDESVGIQSEQVREPGDEEIHRSMAESEQLASDGHQSPALMMAWATLEAAMRRKIVGMGGKAGITTSTRTMLNELFSAGLFSIRELRELEALLRTRDALVHGFAIQNLSAPPVEMMLRITRSLLNPPTDAKQTA